MARLSASTNWRRTRFPVARLIVATNVNDILLQREVVSPDIIEAKTGLSEGNIYAGEFFPHQMYFFRPAPGYSDYRTPIRGYYQCGSGTHPGGCVIGAPGRFASQQVLADTKRLPFP